MGSDEYVYEFVWYYLGQVDIYMVFYIKIRSDEPIYDFVSYNLGPIQTSIIFSA